MTLPKWQGELHPAYDSPRPEITALIPPTAKRVIDIGCSTGAVTADLRERGVEVTGVESDPELAQRARAVLDKVLETDVEALARDGDDLGGGFDCVVLADVLEHLRDPWAVVRWADSVLTPWGSVVLSVPNIRHAKTFWTLAVRAYWPYEEVGIFDRTHLRCFARKNLPELFEGTRLQITEIRRNRFLKVDLTSKWNRLAPYLGDFGTLQFLVRADRLDAPW